MCQQRMFGGEDSGGWEDGVKEMGTKDEVLKQKVRRGGCEHVRKLIDGR